MCQTQRTAWLIVPLSCVHQPEMLTVTHHSSQFILHSDILCHVSSATAKATDPILENSSYFRCNLFCYSSSPFPPTNPCLLRSAASASCLAEICTFPMDTVKVRLQVQGQSAGQEYTGMVDAFKKIVANEGSFQRPSASPSTPHVLSREASLRTLFGFFLASVGVLGGLFKGCGPALLRWELAPSCVNNNHPPASRQLSQPLRLPAGNAPTAPPV
jgi:hypothetical protein